jgi:hypothetical protein
VLVVREGVQAARSQLDSLRQSVEPLFAPIGAAVHWLGEVGEEDKWALLADAEKVSVGIEPMTGAAIWPSSAKPAWANRPCCTNSSPRTSSLAALDSLLGDLEKKFPELLYVHDRDLHAIATEGTFRNRHEKITVSATQREWKASIAHQGAM